MSDETSKGAEDTTGLGLPYDHPACVLIRSLSRELHGPYCSAGGWPCSSCTSPDEMRKELAEARAAKVASAHSLGARIVAGNKERDELHAEVDRRCHEQAELLATIARVEATCKRWDHQLRHVDTREERNVMLVDFERALKGES